MSRELSLREAINPTRQQQIFLDTIATHCFVLFGGAAGGGKSYILRWFAVLTSIHAFTWHGVRDTVFGLFCAVNRHLWIFCGNLRQFE
jgi:hypothetical protein